MKARIFKTSDGKWRWTIDSIMRGCRGHDRQQDALGCLWDFCWDWDS